MAIWKFLVFALKQESEDIDAWKVQVCIVTFENHRSFNTKNLCNLEL